MAEDEGWLAVRHRKRGKAHRQVHGPATTVSGVVYYRCGRVDFHTEVVTVPLADVPTDHRCGTCWKDHP